jgi:hypothetical protein
LAENKPSAWIKKIEKMRSLSVRQPYADRIMRGTKRIENRSRPTKVRGRIYIYASLTPASSKGEDLPHGVIIGTVELFGWRCDGHIISRGGHALLLYFGDGMTFLLPLSTLQIYSPPKCQFITDVPHIPYFCH